MAEQSLWQRVVAAINREYDRRIRRASLITEYGAGHHHVEDDDGAGDHQTSHHEPDHDDDTAEIVNVPKGTPIMRRARPTPPVETDSSPK